MQRHLAAFIPIERHAGARGLALAAAPAGLAPARADAAADANRRLAGAGVVTQLIELHRHHVLLLTAGRTARRATLRRPVRPEGGVSPCRSCRAPRAYPPARGCGASC